LRGWRRRNRAARLRLGFGTDHGERLDGHGGGNFLTFDGEDFVEDVAIVHAASPCVKRTNSSSLARAAPLAMASRAISMPRVIDSATYWLRRAPYRR
jgi:hypothetical protein